MNWTYTLEDLTGIAKAILANSHSRIFLFYGQMGAGKTTLIKEIGRQLGVKHPMSSPTFSLINEHEVNNARLFHCDFYRLKNETEAMDLGIEEYFDDPANYVLIEWPENIEKLLPADANRVELVKNKDGSRTLKLGVPVN